MDPDPATACRFRQDTGFNARYGDQVTVVRLEVEEFEG